MSEEVSPVRPGDLVGGKYRVERTLGAGGMGIVVLAKQLELDRAVALKFLLPKVLERPGLVTRFSREARAAAKLESEHVARVLDVGTLEGGAPYIVMEYLEGQDFASVVASRGPLPPDQAVGYVLQALEAVAEAHSLGIVHRDLKPGNLFLANRASGVPIVKVLDFGLSKFANPEDENVTSESSILGSPLYMSPEQLMSARTADARSDIWSLGVVLYELLTAHPPFQYERIAGLVAAILQKPPQPLDQWGISAPRGLEMLVARCLEKDPAQRFQSVAHLARALEPFGPAGCARSVERIAHVLRAVAPTSAPAVTAPLPFARTEAEADPRAATAIESVAGSSRSIREFPADITLPSGPNGAGIPAPGRVRAWLVATVVAGCITAVALFVKLSSSTGATDRVVIAASGQGRVGAVGLAASLSAPPPSALPPVGLEVLPALSTSSELSAPAPIPAASFTKKTPRAATAASTPKSPSAPPLSPSEVPVSPSSPEDPLRRLKTM